MRRGLVIGKFYPPHKGHKHLIDTAQSAVDQLHVIVCQKAGEEPSGELRASWLRELHPRARVLVIEDTLDPDDSKAWAEHCKEWLGFTPDVVFTSEDYGSRFAEWLGCEHVEVDRLRATFPVSGTAVREDPFANWEFLEPPVRGYYAFRVVLVGSESTGKSTLAQQLAEHYRTVWVPEYGREYTEELVARGPVEWTSQDFVNIAVRQIELENAGAREANRLLICDTDAFATAIWHRRYMGGRCEEVERIAAEHRRPDLYLLTDVNTAFVQDAIRDGEAFREWMHQAFIDEMTAHGLPFVEINGEWGERFAKARDAIDRAMRGG